MLLLHNGAQRARARRFVARRSVPLPASTVVVPDLLHDGRVRRDHEALVDLVGALYCVDSNSWCSSCNFSGAILSSSSSTCIVRSSSQPMG